MPIPRSQNRRGVTMVESALTLSLLLFVIIGIVDIGTVLFTYLRIGPTGSRRRTLRRR